MYFKCSVHQCALKTVSGNTRLQQVWHFRHEQKIFGHPKFLLQKKIIKFWGIRHLEFEFFLGELPQTPAKCNPLSNTLATCLVLRCSSLRKPESNKYQKLLEIEKEIVREVTRGDKPYLRKSTDRKAQIRKAFVQYSGLVCALRSVDFLR